VLFSINYKITEAKEWGSEWNWPRKKKTCW
jgi:hypothetical protein